MRLFHKDGDCVAEDEHFLTLFRYVEANPLRAGLVTRAEPWRLSGLWRRMHPGNGLALADWPMDRRSDWLKWVNTAMPKVQIDGLRECVRRGRPPGTATQLPGRSPSLGERLGLRPSWCPACVPGLRPAWTA